MSTEREATDALLVLAIEGDEAEDAGQDLLAVDGLHGTSERGAPTKDPGVSSIILTIAALVAIADRSGALADRIAAWAKKWRERKRPDGKPVRFSGVLRFKNGTRIRVEEATPERIKRILEAIGAEE